MRTPHPRLQGIAALALLAVLFVAATVLVSTGIRNARLDLTDNRLYTLTEGTRKIARSLQEPVTLRLYFSREASAPVPFLRSYAARVEELLREVASASEGRVRIEVIDPVPFSEEEDRAAELGLQAIPAGASGGEIYLGIAGSNSTDGAAAISFLQPDREAFLEYEVARLTHQLGNPEKPVVGLMSALPVGFGFDPATQQATEPWAIVAQMQELFQVRNLEIAATTIPPEVRVLMLVHPKHLSQATLYAIDQFVMRGGRLLVFVDPSAEQDASGADPMNPLGGDGRASELEPLFSAWGLGFNPGEVIGDDQLALTVDSGGQPVRHLGFLGFDAESLATRDVITAGLGNMNFATTGYLTSKGIEGVTVEPLVSTSTLAAPIPAARFAVPGDPARLYDGFRPTGESYVVAARVSGALKSAFPAGSDQAHLAATKASANIVVVADTDMLADILWTRTQSLLGQRYVQAWAHNGDFVLNALDNLAGSSDLIGIRGRATFVRPFERVEDLRRNADEALRAKETELTAELQATEQKLSELQAGRQQQGAALLSPEQERELDRFQAERVRVRKELRDVRRGLDEDIEALGMTLKVANIVVAPLLLTLLALAIARLLRRRRGPPARTP